MTETTKRRTIRRYAHDLYPHVEEGETRPLETEVKYLYAQWHGHNTWGTDWFEVGKSEDPAKKTLSFERISYWSRIQQLALAADALLQGLTGQAAWDWIVAHRDVEGEVTYDRAMKYLSDAELEQIRPYPVLAPIDPHDHVHPVTRIVTYVAGTEDDCPDCTEEIPA